MVNSTGSSRALLTMVLISAILLIAAGPLFAVHASSGSPSVGETVNGLTLLFADDLSDDAVGEGPSNWSSSGPPHTQVVADPNAVAGKAIQLLGHPTSARQFAVTIPVNAPAVVVDFSLRWVKNGGLSFWVDHTNPRSHQHNVNLTLNDEGIMRYRYTSETGSNVMIPVGSVEQHWNTVRVIAHARNNEAYVFFNDLENPVLGPLPFRTWEDRDWGDIVFTLYDTGRRDDLAETYYSDFKIWAMDEEAAKEYF